MRVFLLFFLILLVVGCAVSPSGSSESGGTQDQEWLVKLATYRVRDETILKSQDKVPLDITDLRDLILKEVSEEDLLKLMSDLGVSPKLLPAELSELASMGASPAVLRKLGKLEDNSPSIASKPAHRHTEPLMTRRVQTQIFKEPVASPENLTPAPNSKVKSRPPSALSSDPKIFIPPINDPNSRRN